MNHLKISLSLVFTLITLIFLGTYPTYASEEEALQQVLGVQPVGFYTLIDLATAPKGSVIIATVTDPSKMGGCLRGDSVRIVKIGNNEWKITNLESGSSFQFTVYRENGHLKAFRNEEETFSPGYTDISYNGGFAGRIGLGVRTSYATYQDDDYQLYGVKVNAEPDDTAWIGINLTYFVSDYFSFELSTDYTKTDVELSALGASGEAGELSQIPILFAGRVHAKLSSGVSPYFSAGVGYFFNDFDADDDTIEYIYGQGAKVSVDDSIGYFIGTGIEYFFSRNAALNIDVKYIWTEIEAEVYSQDEFDINPLVVGLGIKYFF